MKKKYFITFIIPLIIFISSTCSQNIYDSYDSLVFKQWTETVLDIKENWSSWRPVVKTNLIQTSPIEAKLIEEVLNRDKYDLLIEEKLQKLEHKNGVDYVAWVDLYWNNIRKEEENIGYSVVISIFFIHDFEHGWSDRLHCTLEYIRFEYEKKI